jgi:hypothetical protein
MVGPLPISFATFTKKIKKIKSITYIFFLSLLHCFPLKQFFADHLPIFFGKNGLTVGQKLFAL